MTRSISNIKKKRGRGRPKVGAIPVMVRLLPEQAARLDNWREDNPDKPGRPEAIRRLVEQALAGPIPTRLAKTRSAQRASEMADRTAEGIVDKSMPVEEQQHRKRALIKGPKEFRDIREDTQKPKR
jgi:hypothetical protein